MASRRSLLRFMAGAGALTLLGCGASKMAASADAGDERDSGATSGGSCAEVPEETAGPYPGDGSNGKNALVLSGIVRSDIRGSIAGATGKAEGIPLTLKLKVVDATNGCVPLAGYAVYLWHCDRDGNYSMYGLPDENYLRGVQESDDEGSVTFTTIFPGCYSGRMPHMHFEVYPALDAATSSSNKVATSQVAFPESDCNDVYATTEYASSKTNFARTSFSQDNVFADGVTLQLAELTGSVDEGYTATLTVAIAT